MTEKMLTVPHMFIKREVNRLQKEYETQQEFVEIEFVLEEKEWNFLTFNDKFNKNESLKTIKNYLNKKIGFCKDL